MDVLPSGAVGCAAATDEPPWSILSPCLTTTNEAWTDSRQRTSRTMPIDTSPSGPKGGQTALPKWCARRAVGVEKPPGLVLQDASFALGPRARRE